jgi:serine/threonine-protein kinase PpkA
MIVHRLIRIARCLCLLVLVCGALPGLGIAQERRRPVTIPGKQVLPLRVLARPFSNVYRDKDPSSSIVRENVPTFQSFYVYTRPSPEDLELEQGWYEVGPDNRGTVLGWMRAADVFEWKQTLCLAYTHPEGRKPVLMFASRRPLMELIQAPPEARAHQARTYYEAIDSGHVPADFPVESVEPKKAVDIEEQFYLLPILNHQVIEIEGREGRLLQLAAATKAGPEARRKTDIRQDSGYLQQAITSSTDVGQELLKKLAIDVVYVMDTTVSMRPHIAKTLEVIRAVSQQITADQEVAEAIRFGIWGYRDPVDEIPGIGYTTRNYTPDLQPVQRFVETLAAVKVTSVDSVDYPEDVFSGVEDALLKTAWTPGAIRIVILAGDAPAHDLGHPWNLSGQSAKTLRALADDQSTSVFALLVKDPRGKKYHQTAEEQFMTLSFNPGTGGQSTFYSVASDDLQGFGQAADALTEAVRHFVAEAKQGRVASLSPGASGDAPAVAQPADLGSLDAGPALPPSPAGTDAGTAPASPLTTAGGEVGQPDQPPAPPRSPARALADRMLRAALVKWIGSQAGAMAPRDIVAWAVDKDLIDPSIQSMEVKLLINKRQLDSLTTVLNDVMAAGRRGQIGGEDFFTALQATAATVARAPDQIKNARSMAQTGLVPEFLTGLPYKSRLMAMTNELWFSWSVDEQDGFLNELEAKIKAYRAIHDRPEGWIPLNPNDDPDEYVHPINLDLLP